MKTELNFHPSHTKSKAQPLLFIHGMAHAAWCWEWEFVPYFNSLGYDCYTLSLRGHGKSEGKAQIRWHRISDYLTDLENAIQSIGTKPIVVGHSMGGFVTQKYLLKHDDLPAAITLATVPAGGMMKGSLKIAQHFPLQFIKGNLMMSTAPFSETDELVKTIAFSDNINAARLTEVRKHMEPESYMAYIDMLLLDLHTPKKVKTHCLFLYAQNDFIVGYEGWKKTADGFGAEQEVIKDIAHDMFLDTNWERTAQSIANWLNKQAL